MYLPATTPTLCQRVCFLLHTGEIFKQLWHFGAACITFRSLLKLNLAFSHFLHCLPHDWIVTAVTLHLRFPHRAGHMPLFKAVLIAQAVTHRVWPLPCSACGQSSGYLPRCIPLLRRIHVEKVTARWCLTKASKAHILWAWWSYDWRKWMLPHGVWSWNQPTVWAEKAQIGAAFSFYMDRLIC